MNSEEFKGLLEEKGKDKIFKMIKKLLNYIITNIQEIKSLGHIPYHNILITPEVESLLRKNESFNPVIISEFYSAVRNYLEDNKDYWSKDTEVTAHANNWTLSYYNKGLGYSDIMEDLKRGIDRGNGVYKRYLKLFKDDKKIINRFKMMAAEYAEGLRTRYEEQS